MKSKTPKRIFVEWSWKPSKERDKILQSVAEEISKLLEQADAEWEQMHKKQ